MYNLSIANTKIEQIEKWNSMRYFKLQLNFIIIFFLNVILFINEFLINFENYIFCYNEHIQKYFMDFKLNVDVSACCHDITALNYCDNLYRKFHIWTVFDLYFFDNISNVINISFIYYCHNIFYNFN